MHCKQRASYPDVELRVFFIVLNLLKLLCFCLVLLIIIMHVLIVYLASNFELDIIIIAKQREKRDIKMYC